MIQPAGIRDFHLAGLEVERVRVEYGWSKFDLTLFLTENSNGLNARLEYSLDLFKVETIQQMLHHFRILLQSIAADPDQSISTLSILSQTDRNEILTAGFGNQIHFAADRLVHQMIELYANKAPQSLALTQTGSSGRDGQPQSSLTYGEFNQRANQIAHYLNSRGVSSGSLVGVLMDRSPDMIAVLLGILKAGGAYLPLDPGYPEARLKFTGRRCSAKADCRTMRLVESPI